MDEMLKRVHDLTDEQVEEYKKNLMPNVTARDWWYMKTAKGCFVEHENGKKYLDLTSQFFTNLVGFGNEEIAQVIADQAKDVTYLGQLTNTKLRYALAHEIASIAPGDLNKVIFCVGGGPAIDTAAKLALKNRPGSRNFIVLWDSYHGNTFFSGAASMFATPNGGHTAPMPDPKHPWQGCWNYMSNMIDHFARVPNPYCYRCPFRLKPDSCDTLCAEWVKYTIEKGVIGPTAAVIMEPIQSGGAQLPLPKQYVKRVREICDEYGVLLIFDEVQTYARCGTFFAAEYFDVQPDMICTSKGIGGNMPVSVVIASDKLKPFDQAFEEINTQTNNQVAMAASLKSIEIIKRDHLLEHGAKMGERFMEGMRKLQQRFDKIGDVRGIGLAVGVELVKDPKTKEPFGLDEINQMRHRAEELGLIFQFAREGVIKFKPALIITEQEVDLALSIFEQLFEEML